MLTKKIDKRLLWKLFDFLKISYNVQLMQHSAIMSFFMLLLEVLSDLFDVLTSHWPCLLKVNELK